MLTISVFRPRRTRRLYARIPPEAILPLATLLLPTRSLDSIVTSALRIHCCSCSIVGGHSARKVAIPGTKYEQEFLAPVEPGGPGGENVKSLALQFSQESPVNRSH